MELTEDLVAIQGILISLIKTTGDLTKIYCRAGNESKILKVVEGIQEFLASKNYIKNNKTNNAFDKQLEDIVLFLAINTKYKKSLVLDEYDHLINIMPQLSKCVFVNIVYGLDLCKYCSKVLENFPVRNVIEILEEMIETIKTSLPDVQLSNAILLLKLTATKLASENNSEDIDQITEISTIILQLLTGIHPRHLEKLSRNKIHQHMGFTLLKLFDLLFYCNKENPNLAEFIGNVFMTCSAIVKNITVDVFCSWATVKEEDETLQTVVSNEAYKIIQEFDKNKDAKELISMLGSFAKKPKTISERIRAANVDTIVRKVNCQDQNQKEWFKALVGSHNIFERNDVMACISTWARLCDDSDVTRLLNLTNQLQDTEKKQLPLKCASTLTLEQLTTVMVRYFYTNKFDNVLSHAGNVDARLRSVFKKLDAQMDNDEHFVKEMCLLVLENAEFTMNTVYRTCLRNKCYTERFRKFFEALRKVLNVNYFGVDALLKVFLDERFSDGNVEGCVQLLSTLLEVECVSNDHAVSRIVLPMLRRFYEGLEYQQIGYVLQILLGCSLKIPAAREMGDVKQTLLLIMENTRGHFLEMDLAKRQTASDVVEVLTKSCEIPTQYNVQDDDDTETPKTVFTTYYKNYLCGRTQPTLAQLFVDNFLETPIHMCVIQLLTYVPDAVTSEWISVVNELMRNCYAKTISVFSHIFKLLCKIVKENNVTPLKYSLQQFVLALQYVQEQEYSTVEIEAAISKEICCLMRYLPASIKEEIGLSLVNILTDRSLKFLSENNDFVCGIINIKNETIGRALAKKVLS